MSFRLSTTAQLRDVVTFIVDLTSLGYLEKPRCEPLPVYYGYFSKSTT